MALNVLISQKTSQADLDLIQSAAEGIVAEQAGDLEAALAKAPDAEVIHAGHWSEELWKSAPQLRWVQSGGAGVENFLTPDFVASPVILTNAQGVYAVPIADHVMAFILYFSRQFDHLVRYQMGRKWADWGEFRLDELTEKTLGIVGLGGIGSEVATRAKAFGMRVIATRRRPEMSAENVDEVRGADELAWLLGESDFVALCTALTPATRHLIGAGEVRQMKSTAYLINIGRGGLIDENMLAEALLEGAIAGAGLDVFEEEPLSAESPLWDMPGVMITPHVAGDSPRSHERFMALFCENLRRYVAGEPLLNVVDKKAGY
jgi:phosphoglycerate dehydrogenase-like enzyme